MDARLVSLRIPHGWFVAHSSFYELEPQTREGRLVDETYFCQDLLWLQQYRPADEGPVKGPYAVDLGWYPDGAPDGRFRMVLMFEGWDNILHTVESRDWRVIRDAIERALDAVNSSLTSDEVVSRLTLPAQTVRDR